MKKVTIFVLSDSVGETAEQVVKAAVTQFRPDFEQTNLRKFPQIDNVESIEPIVEMAKKEQALIVYTLVKEEMRQKLLSICQQYKVQTIDLLGPIIDYLKQHLQMKPLEKPGIVHKLDEDYFKRIEAIEFAVKYDDGKDPKGLLLADVVLIGVSRTSKTPLSQYLAHKRLKVANVPLVPEVEPPEELFLINPKKCFGLMISPDKLNKIRKERLIALGLTDDAIYAQKQRIEQEVDYFYKIVKKIGCTVIDVTNKAVEETANDIITRLEKMKQIK